jgi:transposase
MEAYSLDLRERVAAACDEGCFTRSEIAEEFHVSVPFITKLLRRRRQTGSIAAKPHAGGFPSVMDRAALAALKSLVAEQPDATLPELRDRLAQRHHVPVSEPTVCRALAKLGLPRKKSRCMPRSATRRESGANGDGSAGRSNRSRRRNASWWTSAPRPRP